ncbi:MAG: hypothetical protein R2810_13325 [Flavobacteriales bacterium]
MATHLDRRLRLRGPQRWSSGSSTPPPISILLSQRPQRGHRPDTWAPWKCDGEDRGIAVYGDGRVLFLQADLRDVRRD